MYFADTVNGIFELAGGLFIMASCWRIYQDKQVRGVSLLHAGFFTSWGFWNLYYYAAVNSPLSWWGGIGVVSANSLWLGMMAYYSRFGRP